MYFFITDCFLILIWLYKLFLYFLIYVPYLSFKLKNKYSFFLTINLIVLSFALLVITLDIIVCVHNLENSDANNYFHWIMQGL